MLLLLLLLLLLGSFFPHCHSHCRLCPTAQSLHQSLPSTNATDNVVSLRFVGVIRILGITDNDGGVSSVTDACGISLRLDGTITDDGGHVVVVAAAVVVVVGIRLTVVCVRQHNPLTRVSLPGGYDPQDLQGQLGPVLHHRSSTPHGACYYTCNKASQRVT